PLELRRDAIETDDHFDMEADFKSIGNGRLFEIEARLKDFDPTKTWRPHVKSGAVQLSIPKDAADVKRGLAAVIAEMRADPDMKAILRAGAAGSEQTQERIEELKSMMIDGGIDDD